MIFTMDRDTRLEKVQEGEARLRDEACMHLCAAPASMTAPWLAAAVTSLWEIQKTGTVEAGVGDLRVSDETAACVGRVLGSIRIQWLPTPDVVRVSGGGVVLRWSLDDDEVEVAVLPEERVLLTTLKAGEISESYELPPTQYMRVNDVLRGLVGPS